MTALPGQLEVQELFGIEFIANEYTNITRYVNVINDYLREGNLEGASEEINNLTHEVPKGIASTVKNFPYRNVVEKAKIVLGVFEQTKERVLGRYGEALKASESYENQEDSVNNLPTEQADYHNCPLETGLKKIQNNTVDDIVRVKKLIESGRIGEAEEKADSIKTYLKENFDIFKKNNQDQIQILNMAHESYIGILDELILPKEDYTERN